MAERIDPGIFKVRCRQCKKILLSTSIKFYFVECSCPNETFILRKCNTENEYLTGGVDLNNIEWYNLSTLKYEIMKEGYLYKKT